MTNSHVAVQAKNSANPLTIMIVIYVGSTMSPVSTTANSADTVLTKQESIKGFLG